MVPRLACDAAPGDRGHLGHGPGGTPTFPASSVLVTQPLLGLNTDLEFFKFCHFRGDSVKRAEPGEGVSHCENFYAESPDLHGPRPGPRSRTS